MSDSHIEVKGKEHFAEVIASEEMNGKMVFVDFWAPWCGPCRMVKPVLEKFAEENDDIVLLAVNVDEQENQELSMEHQVSSIPRILMMKDGAVVEDFVGAVPPAEIQKKIDAQRG